MPWTSPEDRLTPEEHDRFLASVRERAGLHRRRRRLLMTGIGGLGIVLVAATAVVLTSGAEHSQRLRTAGQPKIGGEPTTVGTAVTNTTQAVPPTPAVEPASLSFINTLHGWSLGHLCTNAGPCTPVFKTTRDGGATWTDLPRPPTSGAIRFVSAADGYLYAAQVGALPSPAVPGVFVTHDGGRTWLHSPLNGPVATIVVGATDDWALVGSCSPSCSYRLFVSSERGRSWQATSLQVAGVPTTPVRSGSAGWVYVVDPTPGTPQLWYSGDDGRHWSQRSSGCPGAESASLAVVSSEDLWLVCAGQPSAGTQSKTVMRSRDGGVQWRTAAASGFDATPVGSIPAGGYLSSIAAVSDQGAWMALDRGTMYVTNDGGVTWAQARGWPPPELFFGDLQFVDRQHGWAAVEEGPYNAGNGIYRTTDGGQTWPQVPA